jgi:hypothetical protein
MFSMGGHRENTNVAGVCHETESGVRREIDDSLAECRQNPNYDLPNESYIDEPIQ